jgi:hypothetical protein
MLDRGLKLGNDLDISSEVPRFLGIGRRFGKPPCREVVSAAIDETANDFIEQFLAAPMGADIGLADDCVRLIETPVSQSSFALANSNQKHCAPPRPAPSRCCVHRPAARI